MRILEAVMVAAVVALILLFWYAGRTHGQSPEVNLSRWPSNTVVKIYTLRDSFKASDVSRITAAIEAWRPFLPEGITIQFAGAGVWAQSMFLTSALAAEVRQLISSQI